MRELHDLAAGVRLDLPAYEADFYQHFWDSGAAGFWKLERQQHFQEPGDESWEAFARGEWQQALRLLEARRADLVAEHDEVAQHGFAVRRVRVVEEPVIPYLHWELHLLRLREECGSGVRIVTPEQIAPFEANGPLPEVCTLGDAVMYEVVYDDHGILEGARKHADPDLVRRWRQVIAGIYAAGEPLATYFPRQVASLPAPPGQPAR